MRLIKIRLADCPFWFLGKLVSLTRQNPTSDFVDLDVLEEEDRKIINRSIQLCEIKVFDPENQRIKDINDACYIKGELAINIGDIEDDESDSIPEVFSVTVEDNDEEDDKEDMGPTEADYENAKLLLSKNGNTVKKAVKEIANTPDGLSLLHALLETERANKNRLGIVGTIEKRIMEF